MNKRNIEKVTNIGKPKNLNFSVKTGQDHWVNGLKEIIRNRDLKHVDGYRLNLYRCKVCDSETTGEFAPVCCGFYMRPSGMTQSKVVQEIKSRQIGYQCPECKKVYSIPLNCCLKKERLTKGELISYGF